MRPPVTATHDDTTGAIAGYVESVEEIPIVDAQVGLLQTDVEPVKTNEEGRFAFSNLEPGTYTVHVTALQYEAATQTVSVAAGETKEVAFELTSQAPEGVAFKRVLGPINGKFFCGFGTGLISGPCKVIGFTDSSNPVETTWAQISGNENNIFQFDTIISDNKTVESDTLETAVIEISWVSGSAGSQWLQSTLEMNPPEGEGRNATPYVWARSAGVAPLKVVGEPGIEGEGANQPMPEAVDGFTVGVFPTVDPASPKVQNPVNGRDILVGASAYTEQTFQVWITLFFNEPADPEYSVFNVT